MRLLLLLFLLIQFDSFSQQHPSIGEIYDFEIGDLFQYTSTPNSGPPSYRQNYVVDKWYSDDLDTVFYEFSSSSIQLPFSQDDEIESIYDEYSIVFYTDLDSVITASGPPPILQEVDSLSATCVLNFEELGENYITYNTNISCLDTAFQVNENYYLEECLPYLAGIDEQYNSYARGFGRVKTRFSSWEGGYGGQTVLTYWSKNGEECGSYYEPLSVSENIYLNGILVYPNPSEDGVFYLKGENDLIVRVYDALGKCMLLEPHKSISRIDLSSFSFGIYLLYLEDKSGTKVWEERLFKF